jgi:hypothetical protein
MLSIRFLSIVGAGALVLVPIAEAATVRTVEAWHAVAVPERATVGYKTLELNLALEQEPGARRHDPLDGLTGAETGRLLVDELPVRLILGIHLEDERDSIGGGPDVPVPVRAPFAISLPADGWWNHATIHVECPDIPSAAAPRLEFVPSGPSTTSLVSNQPTQSVVCTVDELTPGDWIAWAELDAPWISDAKQHLRSGAIVLAVRSGDEDKASAVMKADRDAARALAKGDYSSWERHVLAELALEPTPHGWENLASMSVGHVPLDTTAGYYTEAREQEALQYAAKHPDPDSTPPTERGQHETAMARLAVFGQVLPWLKAHPNLEFYPAEAYPDGRSYFVIQTSSQAVTFDVFDAKARAQLESMLGVGTVR